MKYKLVFVGSILATLWPFAAFGGSLEKDLNGLWSKGPCASPEYIFYYVENFYLYIIHNGALILKPNWIGHKDRYIIQLYEYKEPGDKKYRLTYNGLTGGKYVSAGKNFKEKPNLNNLPAAPPLDWPRTFLNRCQKLPPEKSPLHFEAVQFVRKLSGIGDACEDKGISCLEYVFSLAEVVEDGNLSTAELSRLIRIMTYLSVISTEGGATDERISGGLVLASLFGPLIAASLISGSDYDDNGSLSLEEILQGQDAENLIAGLQTMSFDTLVQMMTKFFGVLAKVI